MGNDSVVTEWEIAPARHLTHPILGAQVLAGVLMALYAPRGWDQVIAASCVILAGAFAFRALQRRATRHAVENGLQLKRLDARLAKPWKVWLLGGGWVVAVLVGWVTDTYGWSAVVFGVSLLLYEELTRRLLVQT